MGPSTTNAAQKSILAAQQTLLVEEKRELRVKEEVDRVQVSLYTLV